MDGIHSKRRIKMNRQRSLFEGIALLLAGLLALTLNGIALGGEELRDDSIEQAGDAAQFKSTAKPVERAPWIDALHQARKQGNEAACRELEARATINPGGSETSGGTVLRPCTSIGWVRQLDPEGVNLPGDGGPPVPKGGTTGSHFGNDVKIGSGNPWTTEKEVSMVSDWFGNLYVAWTDDFWPDNWIYIYRSTDGGATWESFGGVTNYFWDVTQPSLAIG
jgi:hypothetical protein